MTNDLRILHYLLKHRTNQQVDLMPALVSIFPSAFDENREQIKTLTFLMVKLINSLNDEGLIELITANLHQFGSTKTSSFAIEKIRIFACITQKGEEYLQSLNFSEKLLIDKADQMQW